MDCNEKEIERGLMELAPSRLSDSLLDRISNAMDEAVEEVGEAKVIHPTLDGDLLELEESLRDLIPHGMPDNMIGRLDEAMSRWHESVPVEEKIVSIAPGEIVRESSFSPGLRSVAAMALLGVGAAFLTSADPVAPVVSSQRIPVLNAGNTAPAVFTPGNSRASLVSANDHGVVWTKDGLPVRCLEVEVNNEVHFTSERGEVLIIAQPKREVMFTPVKFD